LIRRFTARLAFWVAAIVVGLVVVAFAEMADYAARIFNRGLRIAPWLPFVITPLVGMLGVWMTRKWFAGIEGGGIPQVIAELSRIPGEKWPALVSLKLAFGKIMVGTAVMGSGFSFGREAPSVQVGASIMVSIERFLPRSARISRKHLLVVGGGAGIAAAFNTPLAGIVFAIEELNRSIESRVSGLIITGIVLAGIASQTLLGKQSYFGEIIVSATDSTVIKMVLLCSLVTGILGGLFSRICTLSASGWNTRLGQFRSNRPVLFAGLCGLLVASLAWVCGGITLGSGFKETLTLLEDAPDYPWYFGPAKMLATLISYISGLPGGLFAPSLAIGAGLGHDLFLLLGEDAPSGILLVLCMTGFMAAVTQAPITSFVIVMEMVDGYSLIIGLMATAIIASGISRSVSKPLYSFIAARILQRQRALVAPESPITPCQ
jgi:H+/Cl- antiporter ClcA